MRTHTHTEWQTCFAMEGGKRYLQDAADGVQTSAAELGIRLGTSAGRISLSLLNLSADSSKTSAHFRFTRFNHDSLASLCIWESVCHSLALPSRGRAFCLRNVPSFSKMFSGCPPWTIKVILDAHSLTCSLEMHTETLTDAHTETHTGGIIQFTCTNAHVIRQSFIFAFCWHHLSRSGVREQVCTLYKEPFVCVWVCENCLDGSASTSYKEEIHTLFVNIIVFRHLSFLKSCCEYVVYLYWWFITPHFSNILFTFLVNFSWQVKRLK